MGKFQAGLAAVALAVTLAGQVIAGEPGGLVSLDTGDASRGWDGVGRIELGDGGFCTGALISERLVLTAAHCIFDKTSRTPLRPERMTFLAGWRDGIAAADRQVRRAIAHPQFDPEADLMGEIRHDIALLELDHPVRNGHVAAFATSDSPGDGREVGVVSYAHDRAERPSLQQVCQILGRDQGFLIMSCDADFGSSGAPVFSWENGRPAIVSVVSAKAQVKDRKVSLGTELAQPLAELLSLAAASDGVFHRNLRAEPRVIERGAGREAGGAKFLRP